MYTNGPDDLLKNEFGKGIMQKSYSKKWIDDISEDFGLDPLELLNDNVFYFELKLKLKKRNFNFFKLSLMKWARLIQLIKIKSEKIHDIL